MPFSRAVATILFAVQQGFAQFLQRDDAFDPDFQAIEDSVGIAEIVGDRLFGDLPDSQPVVDATHGFDFLRRRHAAVVQPREQFAAGGRIGGFQRRSQQERFFAGQDISADRFAEYGGIAVRVEQVVLQLESQSDVDPEVV